MDYKVLIITASIGSGHTRAAEAIRTGLLARGIAETTVVDFLDNQDRLSQLIKDAYFKMLTAVPHAYELIYQWSQERRAGTSFVDLTALLMKRRLQQLLTDHRPDLVIFTHPFPCCAAAYLRRTQQVSCRLAAVLTDFAVHRLWAHPEVDAYFVANDEMKAALVNLGIARESISVSGIPIDRRFADRRADPVAAGASLLLMGGGTGYGALEKAFASLADVGRELEIITVTGNNNRLKEQLQKISWNMHHRVSVLGYTERIDELMSGATVLITKPGALSCSEALAVGLPMILINPIPGQEEDNAAYLLRQGAAVRVDDLRQLGRVVSELLDSPEALGAMHRQALLAGRPNAAADIVRVIEERFIIRRNSVLAG
jgi:processive 1,2-diacylglycerol beta-glucosyltransferase